MHDLVPSQFFPPIIEYAKLYFTIQHIKVQRYPLLPDTRLEDMDNILIAFSNGSAYYSAATTYLVYYHKYSNFTHTTLLASNSRLHDPIKHPNILDTAPNQ